MTIQKKEDVVHLDLVKAHMLIGIVFLIVVVLAGMTYSMQFLGMYPFKNIEFLSPGRIRMIHTQAVAYAWLANGLFGLIYYIIPKLTHQPVLSRKLGWFVFFAYNTLILLTVVLILGGHAQALEWGGNTLGFGSVYSLGCRALCD